MIHVLRCLPCAGPLHRLLPQGVQAVGHAIRLHVDQRVAGILRVASGYHLIVILAKVGELLLRDALASQNSGQERRL